MIDSTQGLEQSGYGDPRRRAEFEAMRDAVQAQIDACIAEEAGARDALSEAFEALKKYEQVEANAKALAAKELAKRETAALDELGLRRKAVR